MAALPIVLTLLATMAYEQTQYGDLPEAELPSLLDRFIRGGIAGALGAALPASGSAS